MDQSFRGDYIKDKADDSEGKTPIRGRTEEGEVQCPGVCFLPGGVVKRHGPHEPVDECLVRGHEYVGQVGGSNSHVECIHLVVEHQAQGTRRVGPPRLFAINIVENQPENVKNSGEKHRGVCQAALQVHPTEVDTPEVHKLHQDVTGKGYLSKAYEIRTE